ncbi:hypothetical protein MJ575_11235 [Klebsiella pneumoniae]|nr:hypothetical protein MJ575_11235 [Klebsiella pneumoniae]
MPIAGNLPASAVIRPPWARSGTCGDRMEANRRCEAKTVCSWPANNYRSIAFPASKHRRMAIREEAAATLHRHRAATGNPWRRPVRLLDEETRRRPSPLAGASYP